LRSSHESQESIRGGGIVAVADALSVHARRDSGWLVDALTALRALPDDCDDDAALECLLERIRRALGAAQCVFVQLEGADRARRTIARAGSTSGNGTGADGVLRSSLDREDETRVLETTIEGARAFGADEQVFSDTALAIASLHLDRLATRRQQRIFRALVENASDHVSLLDRSAEVLYESPAIERLFGWRVGEISDPRISLELIHPDDRQRIIEEFFALSGSPYATRTVTYRLRTRGGEYRYVEAIWRNLLDDPSVQGVCVSARDITERVLGDVALRESEARYRALFDHFPDALMLYARDRLVLANSAAGVLLGASPATLLGRKTLSWVADGERESVRTKVVDAIANGSVGPVEATLVRDDGTVTAVETFGISMRWHGSEAIAVVVRDVQQRKALTARLMEVDRIFSIGTLAAGVGHEINNPLAYVVLNVEVLANRLRDLAARVASERGTSSGLSDALEGARVVLDDVQDGTRRIRNIVRELRSFSRAGASPFAPVDVAKVVRSALTLVGNEVRSRAELVVDEGNASRVLGDEGRLCQLVINLLSNAAQAFPPERRSDAAWIRLRVYESDASVILEVADNGIGIPADVRTRIFDPFFTTKPASVGTGLGLTICQQIAVSHNGRIDVESEPDIGTTVRVSLPAMRVGEVAREKAESETAARAESAGEPSRRVLVVDDDPRVATALVRVLSDTHRVDSVARCDEALARIRAGSRYDAILCDVMMRGMSGTELYAALVREAPESARVLAFVTGGAFGSEERAAIEATRCPVFEKPVDGARLRAFVAGREVPFERA
jgi:PAS domain S-box-containing protein